MRPVVSLACAFAGVACGGGAVDERVPVATVVGGPPGEVDVDASCTSQDLDCCKACRLVHECRPHISVELCEGRCLASIWMPFHQTRCLALRVLWIDEELCPRIGPTWDNFDDDDDCAGPGPDEEGYGSF